MPGASGAHIKYMWKHQADAVLSQANPVSGTPYGVGALAVPKEDVWIKAAVARLEWTVQPTPLEINILIDGDIINHVVANPVTATRYGIGRTLGNGFIVPTSQELFSAFSATTVSIEYKGQSVQVFAETTGGTVSLLECRVKWARLLPT